MNYSDIRRQRIREIDGSGSGIDTDLVRGGTPVKLSTAGTEITKTDDSWIKNQCTAWVNFDGTDGTIRDSYNISSVTRDDTGKYTVTFETEMDNANYSVNTGVVKFNTTDDGNMQITYGKDDGLPTTTELHITTSYSDTSLADAKSVSVQVFGGK